MNQLKKEGAIREKISGLHAGITKNTTNVGREKLEWKDEKACRFL